MQYIIDETAKVNWLCTLQEKTTTRLRVKIDSKKVYNYLKQGVNRPGKFVNDNASINIKLAIQLPGTVAPFGGKYISGFQLWFDRL